jgi:predicted nucleotidyltransferase
MTIEELKRRNLILLECVSGSKAYGLSTPTSDTDIKGVFLLPKSDFYGLNYIPQINDKTNDTVYYELGRFMELLSLNNPNILELLNTPDEFVLYKHPFLEQIQVKDILSKQCKNTFGKFALSQIKKAKGLKKKIVNPVDKERKNVLAFCFVNYQNGSIPLLKYLELKGWQQENCGLVNIPQMKNIYGLYHDENLNFSGIMKRKNANDVALSSIPKDLPQQGLLYFNKDGYSKYCKDYREYWDWVEKRNEDRYENTKSSGKNYDSKNMMHTFRLLAMAIEIAKEKQINVKRPDRDFLLSIKSGIFEYDVLLALAKEKQKEMEAAFEASDLPETPNVEWIKTLTFQLREQFYYEM